MVVMLTVVSTIEHVENRIYVELIVDLRYVKLVLDRWHRRCELFLPVETKCYDYVEIVVLETNLHQLCNLQDRKCRRDDEMQIEEFHVYVLL